MKRRLLFMLCLCAISLVQAQTFNYTGLEIKQEKVKKKNVYEWEQFIMANYFGNPHWHGFGLTYGRVKLFGFYVNASLGTGFHYGYSKTADNSQGVIFIPSQYGSNGYFPYYTGKISNNQASVTVGGIVRMVIPLYLYAGVGYGYHTVTAQTQSGEWIRMVNYDIYRSFGHGMNFDIGLQTNIKGFTLSLGYFLITNFTHGVSEARAGIGYTFKVK